jgi:hypothetical protein
MKRWISALALGAALTAAGSSCVVREQRVATGPRGCPGGVWIQGHYGPYGRWHPGHWRCPGVYERIEIE